MTSSSRLKMTLKQKLMPLKLWLISLLFVFMPHSHAWEWVHETYPDHCEDYIFLRFIDSKDDGIKFYIGPDAGRVEVVQSQVDRGTGLGMGMHIFLGSDSDSIAIDPPGPGPDGDMHRPPLIEREPDPPPIPIEPDPEPEIGPWTYKVWEFQNGGCSSCGTWTNDEKIRVNAGIYVAQKAMTDPEMQAKVIGNGCGYQVAGSSYRYGSNPCGSYIWNDIWQARERSWNDTVNYTADVRYLRVNTSCSYVGSAAVPGNFIIICRPVYNSNNYQPASVAGNLMHEWTHNMGYGHCGSCATRSQTVPYRIGQYAREVGAKYNNQARQLYPRNW